jgi:hypothetical protein
MSVPMIDTMMEPMQPSLLEKKPNIKREAQVANRP